MQKNKLELLISGGVIYDGKQQDTNYDLQKSINLTNEILNLKILNKNIRLKNAYNKYEINWCSTIISNLFWDLCYNFILYEKILRNPIVDKYEINNENINTRFYKIHKLIFTDKNFRYKSLNFSNYLKKLIKKYNIFYNFYLYLKNIKFHFFILFGKFNKKEILFDSIIKNNFRTKFLIENLNKITKNFIIAPNDYRKDYSFNKNVFKFDYDLDKYKDDDLKKTFIINAIKEIELLISNSLFAYKKHLKILKKLNIKYYLSLDETDNQIFSLLYACKKNNIKTIGFQHGVYSKLHFAYSQIGLDNFEYEWFDNVYVWGKYWKLLLEKNTNLKNTNIKIGSNKFQNLDYKNFKKKIDFNKKLNILVPFEFLTDTLLVGKYINKLINLGHKIYFKNRPTNKNDLKNNKELKCYNLNETNLNKINIIHNLNNKFLSKIDCIFGGNQTTLFYELLPYNIPILFADTNFKLIDEMIEFKYAKIIKYNDLGKIHEILKTFKSESFLTSNFFSDIKQVEIIKKEVN